MTAYNGSSFRLFHNFSTVINMSAERHLQWLYEFVLCGERKEMIVQVFFCRIGQVTQLDF